MLKRAFLRTILLLPGANIKLSTSLYKKAREARSPRNYTN